MSDLIDRIASAPEAPDPDPTTHTTITIRC